ncbi:hypothetical protein BCR44DRAFT_36806, partial [Catenaria anguillulae PL171]
MSLVRSSVTVDFLVDRLASTTITEDSEPACETVYRAVLSDKPWDQIEFVGTTASRKKQYRLHARSTDRQSDVTIEEHLNLGFNKSAARNRPADPIDSPWISFSKSRGWAVFYTLKQDVVFNEKRVLVCLRVPKSQLQVYNGADRKAKAFASSAQECFGHVFVDVHEYSEIKIDQKVRDAFVQWVALRRDVAQYESGHAQHGGHRGRSRGRGGNGYAYRRQQPTYPYTNWTDYLDKMRLSV